MSSICNFVSGAIYNRFSQSPEIQKISIGLGCLRKGKGLLCDPDSSPAPSLIWSIARKTAGVALLAGGLTGLYYVSKPLIAASTDDLKEMFLFGQSPSDTIEQDPYEQAFKLQTNENRAEVLYLSVGKNADHNGAFNPLRASSFATRLSKISKLIYKTFQHPLQICEIIQSASRTRLISDLVISAHGGVSKIDTDTKSTFRIYDLLPANCFAGLSSKARIVLDSCLTGSESVWQPNIAEWISWISGKEVIAPSGIITNWISQCFINPDTGRLDFGFCSGPIQKDRKPGKVGPLDPTSKEYRAMEKNVSLCLDVNRDDYFVADYTKRFNVSSSWTENYLFSIKMIAPTILGAAATWQTMRLGASVLQGSGAAAGWIVDKSAAPIKRLAERTGFYSPEAGQILYTTTKGASQILNAAGKTMHQGMDKLIQPVSNLGSWFLRSYKRGT